MLGVEVDIVGVDMLGVDIVGVDNVGVDIETRGSIRQWD